jgi:very-short-patch-repair endonuclease
MECIGSARKLCECDKCFKRSFANHEKAKYCYGEYKERAKKVTLGSNEKFEFKCNICNHVFSSLVFNITRKINPRWCPYCAIPTKKLCEKEDCEHCFNNSFASHEKSKYWDSSNDVSPRSVLKGSGKKYNFLCNCGHIIEKAINKITSSGRWCPYCSLPPQKLCKKEDCEHCFNNSFESHEKSKYWDSSNDISPRFAFKNSGIKYSFICEKGHCFIMTLNNVTKNFNPHWCGLCVNKTEEILLKWLKQHYKVEHQKSFDWCINKESKRKLRFDFYLKNFNIIIELDGEQHFKQVSNWCNVSKTRKTDLFKMECAKNNNITFIRIYQLDVYHNRIDWKKELQQVIKNYNETKEIYISSEDIYQQFTLK